MSNIIIIGGGAAGMAAAAKAAETPGARVTLIERQSRLGRKLLATGNGRCNLTNAAAADAAHYHGADPSFVLPALRQNPPAAVLEWFRSLGLLTVTEYGGRVFPLSGHAGSVLDVLRYALEKPNIEIVTGAAVRRAARGAAGFTVEWDGGGVSGEKLVVACGGCAGAKLGGVSDGYEILKALDHTVTPLRPALTSLRTAPEYPRALKGVRADAALSLLRDETVLARERGDVLFTDSGLSGTAVFAASRAAAPGQTAALDLFPDISEAALLDDLKARRARWPALPANRVLTGAAQSRLGQMLCKYAGISGGEAAGALDDAALARLVRCMKDFRLPVTGTGGFDAAQVTAGGADTGEFDPGTLQSRLVPGLYACGEVLDVDGDCGGYNLQWAWASGLLAGAAR